MPPYSVVIAILTVLAGVLGGVTPAHASDETPRLRMVADATLRGPIDFYVAGDPGTTIVISEVADVGTRRIASATLNASGFVVLRDATRWRCDRLTRNFKVAGLFAALPQTSTYSIRTGSCRDRFDVGLPRRSRPGATVRMVIRDEWGVGDVGLRVCKVEAGEKGRCRGVRVGLDVAQLETRFKLNNKGRARVVLLGPPGVRVDRPITVGAHSSAGVKDAGLPKILAAGDSLMQGVDAYLADRLAGRGKVLSNVVPNSGISKPRIDWLALAREKATRLRPDASVVFLGGNEGFALQSPAGQTVECCSAAWSGLFAARVRAMMSAYSRGGQAEVLWLAIPAPRDPARQEVQNTVNEAVRAAATGLPRVRIVRLDEVFTPGGVYRVFMSYRGQRVRVREDDGVHLTQNGAKIAADKIAAELRTSRIVR